jgi:hypothetical protein
VTSEHGGGVRGAQLCKTSKAGAASVNMVPAKMGQPPGGTGRAQTPSNPSLPSFSAYHPPTAARKRAAIETECTIESLNANNSSGAPTPAVDGMINSNSAGRNQALIQQRNAQWPTPSAPNYVTVNPEGTKDAQFAEAIGVPPAYFVYVAKQNCLHNLGAQ